jgi:uncharacterized membrane protein YeaQ/YmgE (transglycosylase-associated protein family)
MIDGVILKWLLMILVGALSGTLAARIMKGDSFGFVVNSMLGIAGAIVGGFLFDKLNINAGSGIVKVVQNQFGVTLPENFIGMLVSATIGAIIILKLTQMVGIGRKRPA